MREVPAGRRADGGLYDERVADDFAVHAFECRGHSIHEIGVLGFGVLTRLEECPESEP